ncbi:MAG: alpha/beta hydrolase [Phaeodactylibacter sp.]|nr:alpha/beta hydrolase [Phaeodactylibacter sp.]MCB9273983.1 alpha/beta hydrolase [Lewinellaceae bacterium]
MKTHFIPILALIAGLAFSCQPGVQEQQAPPQGKLGAPLIENDGVKIDYRYCGQGDTTLLFVHGWCINKEYWEPQLDEFCTKYRVVAVDLPGFGHSDDNRDDWRVEKFGEDITRVIDVLGLPHVILIGHSMGGDVVLEAAIQRPEKVIGLIGVDNFKDVRAAYTPEEEQGFEEVVAELKADFPGTAAAYAETALFHPSTDSLVKQRVIDDFRNARHAPATAAIENLVHYGKRETELLQQLGVKLYLINSDATPTDEHALTRYCRAGHEVLPIHATGHYPMIEKPEAFNGLLQTAIHKITHDTQRR